LTPPRLRTPCILLLRSTLHRPRPSDPSARYSLICSSSSCTLAASDRLYQRTRRFPQLDAQDYRPPVHPAPPRTSRDPFLSICSLSSCTHSCTSRRPLYMYHGSLLCRTSRKDPSPTCDHHLSCFPPRPPSVHAVLMTMLHYLLRQSPGLLFLELPASLGSPTGLPNQHRLRPGSISATSTVSPLTYVPVSRDLLRLVVPLLSQSPLFPCCMLVPPAAATAYPQNALFRYICATKWCHPCDASDAVSVVR
jgi:hypothetical protein